MQSNTAELAETLRRAERRSTLRAAMSEVAHELATPLNVALGRAELLRSELEHEGAVTQSEHLDGIFRQLERITAVIRRLVDASSGEGPRLEPQSVSEMINEVARLLEPVASEHGISVRVDSTEALVELDRVKTQQLLANALANSIDALDRGGRITIASSIEEVSRSPEARVAPGTFLCLRVVDEGPGFDAENANVPLSDTQIGTPPRLGYFVSREILDELGGFMTVRSEPGAGADVRICLPVAGGKS